MCVWAQSAQLAPPSERTPRRRQALGRAKPERGSKSRKPSLKGSSPAAGALLITYTFKGHEFEVTFAAID